MTIENKKEDVHLRLLQVESELLKVQEKLASVDSSLQNLMHVFVQAQGVISFFKVLGFIVGISAPIIGLYEYISDHFVRIK